MINTLDLVWNCPACNYMNNIPQQMGCPPCLISDSQRELEQHQQQVNRPWPKQMQQQQNGEQNEAEPTGTEENELEVFKALKEELKCKGLSIGHSDVRGLCKHLNEVKILLENTPLDVLALTQTHLNSNISDNELRIDGYSNKRKDRINREGGGCAIYYKESLDIEEMEKYSTEGLEALWIEAKLCSQRLLIGCVYRPPDVTTFYDKFQTLLENIWLTRKNTAIAGDFNSDMLPRNQSEGEIPWKEA